MSQQIQNLFDTIAPRYDLLNSLLSLKVDQRWRRQAVKKIAGDPFQKVMDLCAGTLALTIALLKTNPICHVTALDFSEEMLHQGKKNLPHGFRNRVNLVVGDAMKLDFSPGSFDAVLCAYGLRNVDNNEVVLQHIKQILLPGGRLVILEFFRPEALMSKVFHFTYAEFVIPLIGKFVSRHQNAYHYLRDSVRRFYTPSAYRELLKEMGFQNIRVKAQTGGISHLVVAEKSPQPPL